MTAIPSLCAVASKTAGSGKDARLYVPTRWQGVPFESFSKIEISGIRHDSALQKLRTVTVKSYAPFGVFAVKILDSPALTKIKLDPGYEMKFAGEDEELRKNKAEMLVMKVCLALIPFTMVLQFRSVIKSVVVC